MHVTTTTTKKEIRMQKMKGKANGGKGGEEGGGRVRTREGGEGRMEKVKIMNGEQTNGIDLQHENPGKLSGIDRVFSR
mgnify:FL=1